MPDTKVSEYPAFYFEQIETKIIDGKKYIVIPIPTDIANIRIMLITIIIIFLFFIVIFIFFPPLNLFMLLQDILFFLYTPDGFYLQLKR